MRRRETDDERRRPEGKYDVPDDETRDCETSSSLPDPVDLAQCDMSERNRNDSQPDQCSD